MVEWFKAPVLKTGVSLYGTMGSNPVLSVINLMNITIYRSVISLRKLQNQFAGRNENGKITVRHRGGGHKKAYRTID